MAVVTQARVLGPPNINKLISSLGKNGFVRHFLLGNNTIGRLGAKLISKWAINRPGNIETWYLAGNCIDAKGLRRLVFAAILSIPGGLKSQYILLDGK